MIVFYPNPILSIPAKREEFFHLILENCLSYLILILSYLFARSAKKFFCLEKVCVPKIGFSKFSNFQLKVFFLSSAKKQQQQRKFLGLPTRVWEDEFPVGKSSSFRGGRKGDPDTKVVWEKNNLFWTTVVCFSCSNH